MKNISVKSIPVGILLSTIAVSCFPRSDIENYNHLCVNVVTGVREHPENCDQYIQCNKFEARIITCPEGQIFLSESISCEEGDRTSCQQEEPVELVTCGEGYFGRMACPGECRKYYNCAGGSAELESCLDGYVYYEPLRVCLPGYENDGRCELYKL